ncbi:hypothetical protein JZ751_007582 [Albula glossodonta]|uniref:Choline/ethanolaminephosphotransferase 1 n=1 Tax=Albula glossodonta TaxID=121402 RepID=A0A8T2N1Y5_9TELE|nr:hypothetical protein JZ751_007582 [Albula glossodonta]
MAVCIRAERSSLDPDGSSQRRAFSGLGACDLLVPLTEPLVIGWSCATGPGLLKPYPGLRAGAMCWPCANAWECPALLSPDQPARSELDGQNGSVSQKQWQLAPLWAYLACALGLFIYQSLDAIDGKQARLFVVLGTCIAVQLGTNPDWMFFCCFAGMFMFYCAHWQTYVSGTLRFGIVTELGYRPELQICLEVVQMLAAMLGPGIDVTEVQIFIIIMYLLAAVGGSAFWQSSIPVINIQFKIVPAICTVLGAIFSCTNYFRVIFTGGVGKNGSTIAGTSVLTPFFHIGSVITLAIMIYKKSTIQLFEKHPCLYILAFGFVAHMTKSEMYLHDLAFLGPGLLFLDQYFSSFIDEYLVLSLIDLVRYCVSVCRQIASHLHIAVFKIKPPAATQSSGQQGRNHH